MTTNTTEPSKGLNIDKGLLTTVRVIFSALFLIAGIFLIAESFGSSENIMQQMYRMIGFIAGLVSIMVSLLIRIIDLLDK